MEQPDRTAQLDQTLAATRDLAKAAATFYREVAQGVPLEAAVVLTNGYVSALIIASMNQGGGDE